MENTTFDINGQQMTAEQVVDSYKKLQTDHTKVTQKNSEYSKNEEKVKPWIEFDAYLDSNGIDKGQVGAAVDKIINDLKAGKAPTASAMDKLDKQIDNTENKELKKQLEAVQQTVYDNEYEKLVDGFEKSASTESIEFNRKDFEKFAGEWLSDLGLGDDDDFTDSQLKKAYDAYEAKLMKESKNKGKIPPLSTSGAASGVTKVDPQRVGGLKGAGQRVMEKLRI